MYKFVNPYFLLLIPLCLILFLRKRKKKGLQIPSTILIKKEGKRNWKHKIEKYFFIISFILMSIALARPQRVTTNRIIKKEGVDIVVALDLSKSMLQNDFRPNRLEKAKDVLDDFIQKRADDRLSLVVFGGDAYTKVPLTFDHNVIRETVGKLTVDDITSNNRTAIGMGIGTAVNRLKTSLAKSKVIILLTDGENNAGEITPMGAAELAKKFGIKVYTIGIGARDFIIPTMFGTQRMRNTELDEGLLEAIASETDGYYFRASNPKEFSEIFNRIDALEKTKIDSKNFYEKTELYEKFLRGALLFLVLGILFRYIFFIRIP